jgi:predicted nucleic acid-binding protein
MYIQTLIDNIEEIIEDDSKFPVVEDGRIRLLFNIIFELIKVIMTYIMKNRLNQ